MTPLGVLAYFNLFVCAPSKVAHAKSCWVGYMRQDQDDEVADRDSWQHPRASHESCMIRVGEHGVLIGRYYSEQR